MTIAKRILILAMLQLTGSWGFSQTDIADYFLALPAEMDGDWDSGPTLSASAREQLIVAARKGYSTVEGMILLDLRNGYLRISGSDSGERVTLTMVLFRQEDHSALIAIALDENFEQEAENGGGPATDHFAFYTVEESGWKDVTKKIAPVWPLQDVYIELPRKGTTIPIYDRGKTKKIAIWERLGDGFISR